jgi:hypothetical protein
MARFDVSLFTVKVPAIKDNHVKNPAKQNQVLPLAIIETFVQQRIYLTGFLGDVGRSIFHKIGFIKARIDKYDSVFRDIKSLRGCKRPIPTLAFRNLVNSPSSPFLSPNPPIEGVSRQGG